MKWKTHFSSLRILFEHAAFLLSYTTPVCFSQESKIYECIELKVQAFYAQDPQKIRSLGPEVQRGALLSLWMSLLLV